MRQDRGPSGPSRHATSVARRNSWRRGRDSNPRYPCEYAAFRVRCFQPLSHLSAVPQGPKKALIGRPLCNQGRRDRQGRRAYYVGSPSTPGSNRATMPEASQPTFKTAFDLGLIRKEAQGILPTLLLVGV